jgi:phospholipid/cholesterol/gamma-HCH transport system permease protein
MSGAAPAQGLLARLGAMTLALSRDAVGILALGRQVVAGLGRMEPRLVFAQAYELANRSLFFVVVIMSFTGAILVVQACTQALRVVGDLTIIGPGFIQLLTREFGPTIVAFMIAARYGAGVAAELGAMTITEQVDAVRMAGADPASHLVLPRVLGGLIGMLPIVIFGTAIACLAGFVVAHQGFGVGWATYFRTYMVDTGDVVIGVAKSLAFGVAVPLVSAFSGLRAFGGAPGVGQATTWAVIASCLTVLGLDVLIGGVGYVVFW